MGLFICVTNSVAELPTIGNFVAGEQLSVKYFSTYLLVINISHRYTACVR